MALVDVEANRPIIDVTHIEPRITLRTKAIIAVHLNGRAAAMGEINRIARKHGLRVIEDAVQSLASKNAEELLGTQSDLGSFSLSVAKIISTGQGGFVVTKDEATHQKLKLIRKHGVSDVVNASWTELVFNFRLTGLLTSIGVVQVTKLVERIAKVKAIFARYAAAMPGFPSWSLSP